MQKAGLSKSAWTQNTIMQQAAMIQSLKIKSLTWFHLRLKLAYNNTCLMEQLALAKTLKRNETLGAAARKDNCI